MKIVGAYAIRPIDQKKLVAPWGKGCRRPRKMLHNKINKAGKVWQPGDIYSTDQITIKSLTLIGLLL